MSAAQAKAGERAALTPRGGATRQALLDSTITLLAETGFAATSTQAVLEHAGVSRGSLLHQFPTRRHLMVAAAEEAMARKAGAVKDALADIAEPLEALRGFPAELWRVENEAPARALAEILLAARWDADLREGLRGAVVDRNRLARKRIHKVADTVGLSNADELAVEFSVLIAAIQGLAATSDLLAEEGTVERTLAALSARYNDCLTRGLGDKVTPRPRGSRPG